MNRYSDMTIWQLQEEIAAIKDELAMRGIEEEDEYHICGGEIRVWLRSQCGLCGDGPIRNPCKREPNVAGQELRAGEGSLSVNVGIGDQSPAPAAPVAEMVRRLEDYYDFQCEGGPLKHCIEWLQIKAALLAKPGQDSVDAARYRLVRNLLAIEDVERLIADGNPAPDEQESLRTDAAIDAALKSSA